MRFVFILTFVASLFISNVPNASPVDQPLLGFSATQTETQRNLEMRYDSLLKADHLKEWMKRLSARPHHIGSTYGKENAQFMDGLFRSWGYQTEIEEFHVLFPTPKIRILQMVTPVSFEAKLKEPEIDEDSTSGQQEEQLPTYNAYSKDGDVTAEVVYVNYGIPKDYEELELRGIDVKGKIVLARYGASWRGVKPKVAAEHGAIGCIIYSDPSGDGYYQGDVYPRGGWRNENSVQRGSVMDFTVHDGDPLTPFVPATKDAKRIPLEEAEVITRIPVLPISYQDALPILREIGGPVAPASWRGSLPIPYHIGPGPATVHLKVEFNWDIVPIYDVIAKLPGAVYPEEWIVRGNHHDAWVNGATDPISGMVALLEEARAISELAKSGWKPKRTLIFAAWDGEEQGLLGSTEWVEKHREELQKKAVAYINSDSNSRGFLQVEGSQTLEKFVNQVGRDVQDPEKEISVLDRARDYVVMQGTPQERQEVRTRQDLRLPALGSGSDYTPFLQHAGIASLNIGYAGEEEYGQYHSIYDSYDHYLKFMDGSFEYGVTLAKTAGRCTLRLASAEILPFEMTGFADNISVYARQLLEFTDQLREEVEEKNRRIQENTFLSYYDSRKTFVLPKSEDPVPHLNFAPLQNAASQLEKVAAQYKQAYEEQVGAGRVSPKQVRELNSLLMKLEQSLTRKEGLPGRPWFTHQIYAPGVYTGYAAKPLPSVQESIEQKKWKLAEDQIVIVAQTLDQFTAIVTQAIKVLKE